MAPRSHLAIAFFLTSACGGAAPVVVETPAKESTAQSTEPGTNLTNVVAVVPVKDHGAATVWYRKWIGRDPDVVPAEGVAEWQLAGNAWLQVALDPEHAGSTSVVVGVKDVEVQRSACVGAGIAVGDTQDFGVVKLVEVLDPDGNKVVFVQETSDASRP